MPIFEYQCEACQHSFEKLAINSEEKCDVCPKCETKSVKRLLSAPGFFSKSAAGGCGNGASGGFS